MFDDSYIERIEMNAVKKVIDSYINKKITKLEKKSNLDDETNKYYSMLEEIVKDGRYVNKNVNMYISVFNITSEFPEFMKPWIKKEYEKYLALDVTNEILRIGINNRYSKAIKELLKDTPLENLFSKMILLVGLEKIMIDYEFFEKAKYLVSFLEPNKNAVYEIDSWKKQFEKIYSEKYSKINV
ncbi:MAG: hypothetical protein KatS3mg002_0616 [Candidatus Woesearchaeota archaeon]|nr:MAG: hypothetical protein KatS3mg002_0616 [Candidatus Woesearchaeota archaeon]